MATISARQPNTAAIGVLALVQGGILVAFGLSVALASSYVSDMRFVFGPIDPSIFHELRVMLGYSAVIVGASSGLIGLGTMRRTKWAWHSNMIVTGLAVAVLLAIHDIVQQPIITLLLPVIVSGVLLASLLGQKYGRFR